MENTSKDSTLLQPNYTVTTIGTETIQREIEEERKQTALVIVGSIVGLALLAVILLELGAIQSFAKKYAAKAPGILGDLLEYLATRPSFFRKKEDFSITAGTKRFTFLPLYNYLCLNDYLEMEGMLVKVNSFTMKEKSFELDLVGFSSGFIVGVEEATGGVVIEIDNHRYSIKMPQTTDLIRSV